jgi:phage repressor protein C with HTH and peptisase S24 domain
MKQTRRARHNRRHGGVKNATLKAEQKALKEALRSQKRAEAQILKDVRAFKKEEKARIKEEKARIKALKKTKKAKPKAETSADVAKVEKLALELYKKSSAMKAKAKADIIDMGRDVDKERIDIMLEDNFYWLIRKEHDQVWLNKARAKLNK